MMIRRKHRRILNVLGAVVFCIAVPAFLMVILAPNLIQKGRVIVRAYIGGDTFGTARIATGGENGAYYALGQTLKSHVSDLSLDIQNSEGSIANLRMLVDGESDFALIQSALSFSPEQADSIRAVARLMPQYIHVIVPKDSSVRRVRDLAGKRIAFGPENGGAAALAESIREFARLDPPATPVYLKPEELEQAFEDDRIDAAFEVYALFAPAMEQLFGEGEYRLIPMENVEALSQWIPGARADAIPAGSYGPGRHEPPTNGPALKTLAVDTLLVTHKDTSDVWVNQILGPMCTVSFVRDARLPAFNEHSARQVADLPLHNAAEKFYARNDPITSDSFEIASFFLAGIVCLASTIHFFVGRRERMRALRRRTEIEPYFEHLIDIGERAADTTEIEELIAIVYELTHALREGERKWLSGKLGTEDMDNLYSVCHIRSQNAYFKIFKILLLRLQDQQTHTHKVVETLAENQMNASTPPPEKA
jgi:hypothetical protein